jgi:hypothetical protein
MAGRLQMDMGDTDDRRHNRSAHSAARTRDDDAMIGGSVEGGRWKPGDDVALGTLLSVLKKAGLQ